MEFVDLKTQYAQLRDSIRERIERVLEHGQYILGPEVREMEEALAAYTGARHCIAVASGSEALLIALLALGVGRGDEVVTTPFSFFATAEMIALAGARPVFVDVEEDTANIDASRIEAALTPRTRAILPVALYGQPADMDRINALAARRAIPVIEDAAQSFGATYRGRRSGNLCTVGCTSFFPSKPLGCYGDGGAIFTNDEGLARACREIRVHGQEARYRHTRIGVGGRMDTLQCAVVLAKLERFDWEIARRIAIGRRYDELLAPQVRLLEVKPERTSVYAQYTIRVPERERLARRLKEKGIPTAVHYPLALHRQPVFAAEYPGQSFPVAERLSREVLSLPMHPYLEPAVQDRIALAVTEIVSGAGAAAG